MSTGKVIAIVFLCFCASAQTVGNSGELLSFVRGDLEQVEQLKPEEIAKLDAAGKKFAEAQKELVAVTAEIRRAHGEQLCPDAKWLVYCTGEYPVVLDGKFALRYHRILDSRFNTILTPAGKP